ncbi:MAG TPA: aminoacyl-tRNA hydrolase [Flavobacteriales bacterium]|nr:aminoacyl-tRNA hydrolase [Flavobacteriales bacterium]
MKFLIAGLGNIGAEYENTRHNIGFKIADALAAKHNASFTSDRYAHVSEFKIKNKQLVLIKPTTFMNLSGNAVRYWMQKEKIEAQNILVVIDELALPFGTIRLKGSGSDGGHNGLKNIQELLQSQNYPRLRFGIAAEFSKGKQVDYVLGEWNAEEKKTLAEKIDRSVKAIETFCLAGLSNAMNEFNRS